MVNNIQTNVLGPVERLNCLNKDIYYYIGAVYEYDVKNAYPSILKHTNFNFVDTNLRRDINNISDSDDKLTMLIRIGKECKYNPEIMTYLTEKLLESVTEFQIQNKLSVDELISIKKDAIFTTKECKINNINNLLFREKHIYSMYFYEPITRYEFYIIKRDSKYLYSIKGLGKEYDKNVWGNIINVIYLTLTNADLTLVKNIQKLFMSNSYKCLKYCPNEIIYRDYCYIDRNKLTKEDCKYINFRDIYFTYYAPIFKTLINYIL